MSHIIGYPSKVKFLNGKSRAGVIFSLILDNSIILQMKRASAIVLFTVVCIPVFSQVIIHGSDFIQPGTVLNYQTADPFWSTDQELINTDGQNALWNAMDWIGDVEETLTYKPLDEMSFTIKFFFDNFTTYPETYSTQALEVGPQILDLPIPIDISDGYTYSRTDSTGYYGTGLSFSLQGFPFANQNEEVERIYKFPMHYGDVDTSGLAFLISVPGMGAYGQVADRYSEVDGQGSLVTPYGTYDVLRVRSERYITDTLYGEQLAGGQIIERPLQIDYAWISPQIQGPILEMSVIENEVVSARMLATQTTLNVLNSTKPGLEVYPNPARDFIFFDSPFAEKATFQIYDNQGRLVLSTKPVEKRIHLNKLTPGMYVVRLDGNGSDILTGKLVIIE